MFKIDSKLARNRNLRQFFGKTYCFRQHTHLYLFLLTSFSQKCKLSTIWIYFYPTSKDQEFSEISETNTYFHPPPQLHKSELHNICLTGMSTSTINCKTFKNPNLDQTHQL